MSARSKARKRALDVLFEAEARGVDPLTVLAEVTRRRREEEGVAPHEYTVVLVEGVCAHADRIDEILQSHAHGWVLGRMPAVDRNVARLATFELLWGADVPDAVVLDEAVGLCQALSTEESPGFVNGVLAGILRSRPTLVLDHDDASSGAAADGTGDDDGPPQTQEVPRGPEETAVKPASGHED